MNTKQNSDRGLCSLDSLVMPHGEYRTIVADPPWELEIGKVRTQRGPVKSGKWNDLRYAEICALKYPTMTLAEICALKIPASRDAHCYIWTINRHLEATYTVMRKWGFKPSTLLVWCKKPMGLGLGGTYCNTAEFILFGRRGSLPATRRVETTWWNWKRGKHSEKPENFQDMVESVSPAPYLELFARRRRLGWQGWGNEA